MAELWPKYVWPLYTYLRLFCSNVLETLLLLLVEHHISPLPSSILCEWCVRNIVVIISLTSHLPAPSNVKLPHSFQCHGGCVNCLQWNKSGQYLLSGSDDTNVCLWEPLSHKLITTIPSHHEQNVFSVKVGVLWATLSSFLKSVLENMPLLCVHCCIISYPQKTDSWTRHNKNDMEILEYYSLIALMIL